MDRLLGNEAIHARANSKNMKHNKGDRRGEGKDACTVIEGSEGKNHRGKRRRTEPCPAGGAIRAD
jgi:hypothetical protein